MTLLEELRRVARVRALREWDHGEVNFLEVNVIEDLLEILRAEVLRQGILAKILDHVGGLEDLQLLKLRVQKILDLFPAEPDRVLLLVLVNFYHDLGENDLILVEEIFKLVIFVVVSVGGLSKYEVKASELNIVFFDI